jgi:quinone-modifying oxidoreductase subunit QmoC
MVFLALVTGILIYLLHGPVVLSRVELETFAPVDLIEAGGIVALVVAGFFVVTNIYRMYRSIMSDVSMDRKPSLSSYISEFFRSIPKHFLTQVNMVQCRSRKGYWIYHLIIFYGFGLAFLLSIIYAAFLRYTEINKAFLFIHPLSVISIVSFIALLVGISIVSYGRLRKSEPIWSHSHSTDWAFLGLLLLLSVTGILVGIFRTAGWPMATYLMYSIHLMIVVPFIVIEFPFGKWSHLIYRPLAIYFYRLRELSLEKVEEELEIPSLVTVESSRSGGV